MKKIAVVTGASSGMGVCFAKEIAREKSGINEIWIVARREDRLLAVKEEVSSINPEVECRIVAEDISGREGAMKMKRLFDAEEASGGLEISLLVNNAGFGTYGEFSETDTGREMEMVDLNCTSLVGITGFALPHMKRGARIINTASLASFLPLGNFAVYGASKAFVLSFGVALAAELKDKGISVTNLCPGPVSTEFAMVASKGARKEVRHGLSPEETVSHAMAASRKGRLYSMKFLNWKFQALASRFVGRYAGAWFTFRFCKRPSNK